MEGKNESKHTPGKWLSVTAVLEENEKLKYRILEIEKCEQDLSGRLQAEVDRLKNDLLDALNLKEGNGPTALSMLRAEVDRLTKEKSELLHWLKLCLAEIRTGYELHGILKKEDQDVNSPLNQIKDLLTRIK